MWDSMNLLSSLADRYLKMKLLRLFNMEMLIEI